MPSPGDDRATIDRWAQRGSPAGPFEFIIDPVAELLNVMPAIAREVVYLREGLHNSRLEHENLIGDGRFVTRSGEIVRLDDQ